MNIRFATRRIYALFTLLGVFVLSEAQEDPELRERIHEYGYKGYLNVEFNINLDTAEYYLTKALELQYSTYNEYDDRIVSNHILLASVYRRLYDNNKALYHLEKAETVLKGFDPTSFLFGAIYNNKGNIIAQSNDVYRTIQYYEYALDFMTNNGYRNTGDFSHIFSNYIKLLFELEEYELAEEKLKEIDINSLILKPYVEFRFNLIFATSFSSLGQYENALNYFNQAERVLHSSEVTDDNLSQILYYSSLIDFYILFEEYKEANNVI